jgi:hypothetical protein
MSISVFNTKKFEDVLTNVRVVNSMVLAVVILPLILMIFDSGVIRTVGDFFAYGFVGTLFPGWCIPLVVGTVHDDDYEFGKTVKLIIAVIFSPTIIIVEPLFRLIYYIMYNKKYKRSILYKMVGELRDV